VEWLLGYELRGAARHRYFVSVVMMAPLQEKISMARLLKDTIRASDQIFTLNGEAVIVMAHTANNEAQKAVERYRRMCNGQVDVRYSIATYPDDGGTVADILKTAEQRLAQAKRGEFGTVVSSRDSSNACV
jgi:GGDEF domain-containing protein